MHSALVNFDVWTEIEPKYASYLNKLSLFLQQLTFCLFDVTPLTVEIKVRALVNECLSPSRHFSSYYRHSKYLLSVLTFCSVSSSSACLPLWEHPIYHIFFLFSGKNYKVNEVGAILSQSEFSSTTTRDWLSRGTAHIQVNDKQKRWAWQMFRFRYHLCWFLFSKSEIPLS